MVFFYSRRYMQSVRPTREGRRKDGSLPMLALFAASLSACTSPYNCARTAPFHPRIHSLGNVGLLGGLHASCARGVTRLIDFLAYGGRNMRREVVDLISSTHPDVSTVLELGCGVGTLTAELVRKGYNVTAVDTSPEMIERARRLVDGPRFSVQNAVDADPADADVVIACMLFHELPACAHEDILSAMLQCPRIWVVDITKSYLPSDTMLYGEPYVPSYLSLFSDAISDFAVRHGRKLTKFEVIPDHVDAWALLD